MKNITAKQVQLIHIALSTLNIDDETYREILHDKYNKQSSKDLHYHQASELLDFLKTKGFKLKRKRNTSHGDKVVQLATPYQKSLIEVLKSNIIWKYENGYKLWLNKRMRLEKVRTINDAFKVIEGLKGMLGIKTDIIDYQQLPFPIKSDKYTHIWVFDTVLKTLVKVSEAKDE